MSCCLFLGQQVCGDGTAIIPFHINFFNMLKRPTVTVAIPANFRRGSAVPGSKGDEPLALFRKRLLQSAMMGFGCSHGSLGNIRSRIQDFKVVFCRLDTVRFLLRSHQQEACEQNDLKKIFGF